MRSFMRFVQSAGLLGALIVAATAASPRAHASGLSALLGVRKEFYFPLVPVRRQLHVCFSQKKTGPPTLGVCPDSERTPASDGVIMPSPVAMPAPSAPLPPPKAPPSPVGAPDGLGD